MFKPPFLCLFIFTHSLLLLWKLGLLSGLLFKLAAQQAVSIFLSLHLTFPQSLWLSVVAEGIFAFFLLALSFSPALTTSLVSFLQVGQYLAKLEEIISVAVMRVSVSA